MAILGIGGHPYVDMEGYLDLHVLESLDEEIAYSLARVPTEYTGGSHKTMGIVPPSLMGEPYVDYGQVIRAFTKEEFLAFVSLSDTPDAFQVERHREYRFGEEEEWPLSRRQMLYLKYRYGVYFPWQIFYEMIPTSGWDDKATGGKDFTAEAKRHFPRVVRFVNKLPFRVIGRCNILGLEANHHGTVHQDGDRHDPNAEHFITLCPRGNKRLFLWDEERREKTIIESRAYWFNDHGYHGVEPDPFFRYSIRVDGVFTDEFVSQLRRDWGI